MTAHPAAGAEHTFAGDAALVAPARAEPLAVCPRPFRVLCLDGGGAKGVYTLAILRELEAATGDKPLAGFFDAIYGTSTGAIIAALLGLGRSSAEVLDLYLEYVPTILKPWRPSRKSRALAAVGDALFGNRTFADFQTAVGIVATHWTSERPLIFKSHAGAAYGLKSTFKPGFGCTISQAVQASCSASPFFERCVLDLGAAGMVEARDGGFAANNPSLLAVTDALGSFGRPPESIRLLNLGVGHYPEPKRPLLYRLFQRIPTAHLLQKTLSVNANTTEGLMDLLLASVPRLRISDRFEAPELATDFLEHRRAKLKLLILKGRESFARREADLARFFDHYA